MTLFYEFIDDYVGNFSTFSKLTIQPQERCELHYYAAVLIAFHKVRVIYLLFFFSFLNTLGSQDHGIS